MLVSLTYYYPHIIALAFAVLLGLTPIQAKGLFFLRAIVPLVLAILLAHLNRMFDFWPAHHYFASGHLTFCLGVSYSMARLQPLSLTVTLPLLVLEGVGLTVFHFHRLPDVLGAIPIMLISYSLVEWMWPSNRALTGETARS